MGAFGSLLRPHPDAVKLVSVEEELLASTRIMKFAIGKERLFGNRPDPTSILFHHEYLLLELHRASRPHFCRLEFGHQSAIWLTFLDEIPPEIAITGLLWRETVRPRFLSDLPRQQGMCAPFTNNCQHFRCRITAFLSSDEEFPPATCCYLTALRRKKSPSRPLLGKNGE